MNAHQARREGLGLRFAAAAVGAVMALAGCTTIPANSAPQVVQPVLVQPPGDGVGGPLPGDDPRTIVQGFLTANGDTADPNHTAAKQYLTRDERSHWSDATVTIVDHTTVRNMVFDKRRAGSPQTGSITVTGDEIGSVDETGTYKPFLRGNGSGLGSVSLAQTYKLTQVNNEWRIDSLPPGLLVTSAQFQLFRQYSVYFFDASEQNLVPTPRYTQLSDPKDVVPWLVENQLAGQPPGSLSTGFPPGGSDNVKVSYPADPSDPSQPISIEVPGASALDGANLDRLASQLGATLQQVLQVDRIQITDGGTPVRVPAVGGAVFSVEAVADRYQPTPPGKQLYFVHGGAVYQDSGRRIPGKAGLGVYGLTSVAVTVARGALQVAGVRGVGADQTLDLPSPHVPGALVSTSVHGELSRPSWAPGRREVWIGNGSELERVTGPNSVQNVALNVSSGKASGRVIAVRISPDGGRVALVLQTADSSQIYVGNVVRNTNQVTVENLQPISPQGVRVSDVAWNDQLKLFVTGVDTVSGDGQGQVYEVKCDGSAWTPRGNLGLPGTPQSVTAASGSEAVVSVGNTIYQQQGASWRALLNGESLGTNPVYLE